MQHLTKTVLFGAIFLGLMACTEETATPPASSGQPQAMPVETLTLRAQNVDLIEEMPGRTVAYRKADLRPQVDGIIEKRNFTEGALVEAGQQLYLIDPAIYQTTLDSALAEQARLTSAYELAKRTRTRFADLRKNNSVSKDDYDNALSAEAQAKAALQAAKAQVKQAEINLRFTKVEAPISGQIGASTFTEGALVIARQTEALATITQLDPIYVDITQAGSKLLHLRETIKSGRLQQNENSKMSVSIVLGANGKPYEHKGTLEFSDVTVNETTGTVRLRAVFPNPDKVLLPGMFVKGLVHQGALANAFLIPQNSVMRRPDGTPYLYAVSEDNKAIAKDLTIEKSSGKNWIVIDGVKDGEQIIINGLQRVSPGMDVMPMPSHSSPAK
ncbi:efflux RND transporter periplasmic adaptor subunit [Paraglaciecola aquimarina]|uniref:Efflux RND transporter periplasmic adaptor subunit n=1 Tax=Paraglaciecola aquimarina TaxID=1235557 RepID=A0ABU3T053_9ALTE|nr:efflux RND transporter periplasmic adaptor subunit [Paraglaciecola aquimarina]MDU0355638.1 efflux RND transporter periplasmic adaptor subunit [Paraglaciecola aquimarina]